MSSHDWQSDLAVEAEIIALKARAIKTCDVHEHVTIDQQDPDANKLAFALGTIRWKKGDLEGSREQFMAAIDDAIRQSPSNCCLYEDLHKDEHA